MTAKLRVAMIGAGSMANLVHYPSLASFDDVEIAAICDRDPGRLSVTGDKYKVAARYADYACMIEETAPDAVYAIGDPDVMYPVWVWCLQQALPLFIEKPMGLTLHQARALAHLAEQKHVVTQVGFQRRSCPLLKRLYSACRERGPLTHAVCEFYKCSPEPFLGARDHMMDDGVHAIDTLRWLCGGKVVDINSVARSVGTPDINFLMATLRFDTGATGVLINSWTSGRRIFRVEMHAPGICAEADPEHHGTLYADGDTRGVVHDTRAVAGSSDLYGYGGFRDKSREFLDCVRSGGRPSSHFGDAVQTMEVAERILAQSLLREALP